MSQPRRRDQRRQPTWPTPAMLEAAGFTRCKGHADCTTYIDPINVPSGRCQRHQQRRKASANSGRRIN